MQEKNQPHILITNDDGITSENLLVLVKALAPLCHVFVVAPDSEKSGVSHAFTHREGLSCNRVLDYEFPAYAVSGTPADCIKFAVSELFKDQPIDLVFSGINVGENAGVSSIYSGTVAAAREAALWKIPAVALSLQAPNEFMLQELIAFAKAVVENKWYSKIPAQTFWNVNFPDATVEKYQGIRATTMGLGMFTDYYECRDGLWYVDGCKIWEHALSGSDDEAISLSFASLTPLSLNPTDHIELNRVQALFASVAQ